MTRHIAITDQSVWAFEREGTDDYINGRMPFSGYGYNTGEQAYTGYVSKQEPIRVGQQFVLDNLDGGYTRSGIVRRIVNLDDEPAQPSEGTGEDGVHFIRLSPSWNWLLPFVASPANEDARRAFDVADLLATLVDMGRVTQEDLRAARDRRASA